MRTTISPAAFLTLLILLTPPLSAQYWGERPMEKGFEPTEFFFVPNSVTPFGIGSFAASTPGVVRDPLLDLSLNPAYLRVDTAVSNYFLYTDFRASRNVRNREERYIYPWMTMDMRASYFAPYPRMYIDSRKELEPVFSGAYVSRILPLTAPDLYVGATYQLVLQDEKYYDVPSDLYKSVVGADYSGRTMDAAYVPIVDKYSGDDNMHQNGHFVSLFARYALKEGADIGIKLGRASFARNGAFGNANLGNSYYYSGQSLYSNRELRDQSYGHWDLAAGILYPVSDVTTLGLSAGRVWGTGTQSMVNNDTSYYANSVNPSTNFSNHSMNKYQNWRHDGGSTYLTAELTSAVGTSTTLTLMYRRHWSNLDLSLGTAILDTSYSAYRWTDQSVTYDSYYRSYLSDFRTGGGEQRTTVDRLLAALRIGFNESVSLSVGAQLELFNRVTETAESVLMANRSAHWNTRDSYWYQYGNSESKDLYWTFTSRRTTFRVPIFLTIKASEKVEVLLALNREMAHWKIDDVTLAIFRYRTSDNNGTVQDKRNFGERTTMPVEQTVDITTTFMAGVTVAPSPKFKARMLVVPVFADHFEGPELEQLQWWFGLTVTP